MTAKSLLVATMLFSLPYAYGSSGAGSIGTVSVRGDLRVDGYAVQGNGTLFDGTALETTKATATLRMNNGTEITLAKSSHGVVYSDRLVLLQGESEVKASGSPFILEAAGIRVLPAGPNSDGIVLLSPVNTVDVAAVTGEFRILNNAGLSLASVSPKEAMSFSVASQAGGSAGTVVTETGKVSSANGRYYLTASDGTKYELTGEDVTGLVGKKVVVNGTLHAATTAGGTSQIDVSSIELDDSSSKSRKVWIGMGIAGAGAGTGIAVFETTKSPASR